MPTYEYVCTACEHEFEAFQSMTDSPLKKCPECGGKVRRKISTGAGLIFKGSGFYITDYKKGKASPTAPSENTDKKQSDDGKTKSKKDE